MKATFSLGSIACVTALASGFLLGSIDSAAAECNYANSKDTTTIALSGNSSLPSSPKVTSSLIGVKEGFDSNLMNAIASGAVTVAGLCGLAGLSSHYQEKTNKNNRKK
ncbi:MAG: hypothetical protein QNJ54_32745 [Prochloraceae cyanobacterium]|nr:hypothetical protein [Prochloraceae cyanobacterium]